MRRRTLHLFCCIVIIGIFYATVFAENALKPNRFEKTISQFEQSDRKQPPPENAILFVGSSSIRAWKTLKQDMHPLAVINRGFGGSQFTDAIHFAGRIVTPYKPTMIVVYEGNNDIAAKKTPETVFKDYRRFVGVVRDSLPEVPIFFMTINPSPRRWSMWDDMKKANELIEQYTRLHDGLEYIDVSTPMLDDNGIVRPEIFLEDNLHMNPAGYRLWTSIIKPLLTEYGKSRPGKLK